jgi:hypothetical protein
MGLPANIIGIMGKKTSAYNPLTTAWIAATLETDTTILNALNTFEAGLIANSLTGKFNAIYPFVGGNSTKHRYNFMDTTQFQLTFNGGWTHSANGALPNGTTGYANTGITPSTTLSLNDTHFSAYLRNNTNAGADMGCQSAGTAIELDSRNTGNYRGIANNLTFATVANADSRGWFTVSRTTSTLLTNYKNGSSSATSAIVSISRPTTNLFLAARNNNGLTESYTARELAFASVGSGLSSGDASTLYTLIQVMQTSLSPPRNV